MMTRAILILISLLFLHGCGIYEAPLTIHQPVYGAKGVYIDGGSRVLDLGNTTIRSGSNITIKSRKNIKNIPPIRAPGEARIEINRED